MSNDKTPSEQHPKSRKRRGKPGDIASLRRVLWAAIKDVEELISDPPTGTNLDQRLRAVQALATISGVYLKAYDAHEVAARLEQLEANYQQLLKDQQGNRWVPAA